MSALTRAESPPINILIISFSAFSLFLRYFHLSDFFVSRPVSWLGRCLADPKLFCLFGFKLCQFFLRKKKKFFLHKWRRKFHDSCICLEPFTCRSVFNPSVRCPEYISPQVCWACWLVVKTFKNSTAERVPSECRQLQYTADILEYLFKVWSLTWISEKKVKVKGNAKISCNSNCYYYFNRPFFLFSPIHCDVLGYKLKYS